MVGLVDRVQADPAVLVLGRVDLVGPVPGTVGRPTLPTALAPQPAHLEGSRVTANRVRQAQTPVKPPANPQLLAPKLNLPG